MPYQQRIDQLLSERYQGKRKSRKDAIVDGQHTLQFGGEEINTLPYEKKHKVLVSAINFLVNKLGGYDNVIGLNVHRDETNDHVHLDTLPLTSDGRLSAKEIYSRKFMKETQQELLTHLQTEFPELDFVRADKVGRGFDNGRSQADFERLSDEKRKHDEEYQKQEETLRTAEEGLKKQMVDSLELLDPDFQVEEQYYDENKPNEFDVNHFSEFIDTYGWEPMPVKTKQGWRQVYDWLHIDDIMNALEIATQRVKDFVLTKADEVIKRLNIVEEKENKLAKKEQKIADQEKNWDKKVEHLYTEILADIGPETKDEITKRLDSSDSLESMSMTRNELLERNLKHQIALNRYHSAQDTRTKEILADTVIGLGYLDSEWRDNLIKNNGLNAINKRTGKEIKEPFDKLLPKALYKASYDHIDKLIRGLQQDYDYNQDMGGRSL